MKDNAPQNAVEFDAVNIVFGDRPQQALPLMDQGKTRSEIQETTRQVLGVHDCSLTVGNGEILVLMGLSGSGKSTLLRAVNGLNPVCRGEVRVLDAGKMTSVTHADAATLRRLRLSNIAMVFQAFGLLPWRTVRENVGLGLELGGVSEADRKPRVDRQLDLVNLTQWADRKVGELSGGMQQRVGLARAFVTEHGRALGQLGRRHHSVGAPRGELAIDADTSDGCAIPGRCELRHGDRRRAAVGDRDVRRLDGRHLFRRRGEGPGPRHSARDDRRRVARHRDLLGGQLRVSPCIGSGTHGRRHLRSRERESSAVRRAR